MVTDESVEMWKRMENSNSNDPMMTEWFPKYYVSHPPHRDTLTPIYYKVVSATGPIFWRREGDETGRSTSFYDLLMEEKNGFGLNSIEEQYTPWANE